MRFGWAIGGTLCLLSLVACQAAEHDSSAILTVASDLDNPPFAGIDAAGRPFGRDVEMMEALAEILGLELEWRRIPFDEHLPAVEGEEVDVVCATLGITPEREERIAFSRPYFETAIAVVVRSGSGEPRALAELGGLRVSAASGTTSERAVLRHLEHAIGVFENKRGLPTTQRLLSREVDAAVMDGLAADDLVRANPGMLLRLTQNLDRERYALALPQHFRLLRERLNRALEELERTGRLRELDERHGLLSAR